MPDKVTSSDLERMPYRFPGHSHVTISSTRRNAGRVSLVVTRVHPFTEVTKLRVPRYVLSELPSGRQLAAQMGVMFVGRLSRGSCSCQHR